MFELLRSLLRFPSETPKWLGWLVGLAVVSLYGVWSDATGERILFMHRIWEWHPLFVVPSAESSVVSTMALSKEAALVTDWFGVAPPGFVLIQNGTSPSHCIEQLIFVSHV